MTTFGKYVKAIKVDEDNRNRLIARLGIEKDHPDDPDEDILPIGWFVVMPFGEAGVSFYEIMDPELYAQMVDNSKKRRLRNGFYEVILRNPSE